MKKITDFLKTNRNKDDLKITLETLKEFKACEGVEEFLGIQFAAWAKLEQFEEFLEHLVNGKCLEMDTIEYLNKNKKGEK